jgi:beta-N-acetylhexosaminidase
MSARPAPDVARRRRLTALAVLLGVLAAGGAIGVFLGGSGGSGRPKVPAGLAQLAGTPPGRTTRALVRQVTRLPLARQVDQLFVVGLEGRSSRDPSFAVVRRHDWGGVMLERRNWQDRQQVSAMAADVLAAARRAGHDPPLVVAAQDGGTATAFPGLPPRAQPTVARPQAAAAAAHDAATALSSLHVSMTLAPVADVGAAGAPFADRVFGEDPAQVAELTSRAVDAYLAGGVIPAVGHFPGQGTASQDPDRGTATVGLSVADLRRRDLVPFRALASRAPVIVMSNAVYAGYDGVTPAVLLPAAIGLLRTELRYRGVVMSDDLAAAAPVLDQTSGDVAIAALRAGADLLYLSGGPAEQEQASQAVQEAVRRGRLGRARIREALLRVLALKRRYAASAKPARSP